MSHDEHHAPAADSGPGMMDTLSEWAKPEGAESSTTVVKMVSDLTAKTVSAFRAAIAAPVAGGASLLAGAVTLANRGTFGAAYIGVNKGAQLLSDASGKTYEFISGNKA